MNGGTNVYVYVQVSMCVLCMIKLTLNFRLPRCSQTRRSLPLLSRGKHRTGINWTGVMSDDLISAASECVSLSLVPHMWTIRFLFMKNKIKSPAAQHVINNNSYGGDSWTIQRFLPTHDIHRRILITVIFIFLNMGIEGSFNIWFSMLVIFKNLKQI